MVTIYKYLLNQSTGTRIPKGAEILSVGVQEDNFYIWALVDTDNETEVRRFYAIGTGWVIGKHPGKYIGTVFDDNKYVWHIFEE